MARTIEAAVKTEAQKSANKPVYLVSLALDGLTRYYTDNNQNVNFPSSGGHTYVPRGMSFSPIKSTTSGEYDRVRIRFDNTDLRFSEDLAAYTFQGKVLSITRVFQGLLSSGDNYITLFTGEMGRPMIDQSACEIEVKSWRAKLQHEAPKRLYGVNCPHIFDSADCLGGKTYTSDTISFVDGGAGYDTIHDSAAGFITAGFRFGMEITVSGSANNDGTYLMIFPAAADDITLPTATLTAEAAGATVTITSSLARETTGTLTADSDANDLYDTDREETDNYWKYGTVEMTSGAADGQIRPVKLFENSDGHIEPLYPFTETPSENDTYKIRRGCNKTSRHCKYTYANFLNFGGFSQIPRTRQV